MPFVEAILLLLLLLKHICGIHLLRNGSSPYNLTVKGENA